MADIQAAENDLQRARAALLAEAKKSVLEAESGLKKAVRSVDTVKVRHAKAADKAAQAFKKKKELGSTAARRAKHAELVAKARGLKDDLEAARTAKMAAQAAVTLAKSILRVIEKRDKAIAGLDELQKAPSPTRKRRKTKAAPAKTKAAPKKKPAAKKAASKRAAVKKSTTTPSTSRKSSVAKKAPAKRKSPGQKRSAARVQTEKAQAPSTQASTSS